MPVSLDLVIPLDTAAPASNPQRFAVRGKYIAIDPGSTGQANMRINSISDVARLASPGQTFNPGPFTDLYFDYLAQPGKFLHVLYGDEPDILNAGNKAILDPTLNSSIYQLDVVNASGINNIITAAQNVRGIKILGGSLTVQAAPGAAVTNASSILITSAGAIASVSVDSGPAGSGFLQTKSFVIPSLIVPPGQALQYGTNHVFGAGFTLSSIFLNYQLL